MSDFSKSRPFLRTPRTMAAVNKNNKYKQLNIVILMRPWACEPRNSVSRRGGRRVELIGDTDQTLATQAHTCVKNQRRRK